MTRIMLRFRRSGSARLVSDVVWKSPLIAFVISLGVALTVGLVIWTFNPWFMALFRSERRMATAIGSGGLVLLTMGAYQNLVWKALPVFFRHERNEISKKEAELYRLATRDTLTGLPNRPVFEQYLRGAIARAKRHGTSFAVGLIDLDDFKPVNDTWGHHAGDVVLEQLAQRLQSGKRDSDFLARLGGDEFVVLIEDLDPAQAAAQLPQILARLHRAVEDPFAIAATEQAQIGMTMGLALFPFDAQEPDGLIREADAAMYQAKTNKVNRAKWWQLGTNSSDIPRGDPSFDPYGAEAADLLARHAAIFESVAALFGKDFYDALADMPGARVFLMGLSEEQIDVLNAARAKHFLFLMGTKTTQIMLRERAFQLGEIHALVGVNAAMLVRSFFLYQCLLGKYVRRHLPSSRDSYYIQLLTERRLQDDIQAELKATEEIKIRYFEIARQHPGANSLWADVVKAELARLAALPGIVMCALLRPDSSGIFQFEASAGDLADTFCNLVDLAGIHPRIESNHPSGHGLVATAWLEGTIQNTFDYTSDPRTTPWHDAARAIAARSLVAIPIRGRDLTAEFVLVVFGAYQNQFNSTWMGEFCRLQKCLWEGLRQRSHATSSPVTTPQSVGANYRRRLFDGGLTMFAQPIIDLNTGHIFKVETLARLQQADGSFLPPSVFLPLLGQADLDRLFRLTLDLSLRAVTEWDAQGLHTDIAVNLAPSNLLNPECVAWVLQALNKHAVAPERLTLEILESQPLPDNLMETALTSLSRTGVQIALDDLGSGYSSLRRLADWPLDVIKIDQGLLSRIHDEPLRVLSLLLALIQMGRDLDRKVVVEGLEKTNAVEAAAILGASYGQGYGLARPMPASVFPDWARSFLLSVEPGRISTALGALAYHWKFMHDGRFHHQIDVNDCPLTGFLAGLGHDDITTAIHLHAQVHAKNRLNDDERQQASKVLVLWLAERVREEGWGCVRADSEEKETKKLLSS